MEDWKASLEDMYYSLGDVYDSIGSASTLRKIMCGAAAFSLAVGYINHRANKKYLASLMTEHKKTAKVAETAKGSVEYVIKGCAPYILVFHGSPVGTHTEQQVYQYSQGGFGTICPSRPGFLGTPLSTGRTFKKQAAVFAALLDTLQVDEVVVHGIAGGGPSAIHFAAAYPERTKALLLTCAVSVPRYIQPDLGFLDRVAMRSTTLERFQCTFLDKFPEALLEVSLQQMSTLDDGRRAEVVRRVSSKPQLIALFQKIASSARPMSMMMDGYINDIKQFRKDYLPLDQIQCPCLIAHGTCDGDVPFAVAEAAAKSINNAELYDLKGASHMLPLADGFDKLMDHQISFMKRAFAK